MVDERLKDKEWLHRKYWDEGLTLSEIGDITGHPSSTVGYRMKKMGVKRVSEASWIEKFWRNVNMEYKDECWEWRGSVARGYGVVNFGPEWASLAHRVSYHLREDDPGEQYVLHQCDNKKCVNPNHLYLGDQSKNMEDAKDRGQIKSGEQHPHSKLSEKDVSQIRKMASAGYTHEDIAEEYGIVRPHITNIINGVKWSSTDT